MSNKYAVKRVNILTDRSRTYDVLICDEESGQVEANPSDEREANLLLRALEDVGFDIRDAIYNYH